MEYFRVMADDDLALSHTDSIDRIINEAEVGDGAGFSGELKNRVLGMNQRMKRQDALIKKLRAQAGVGDAMKDPLIEAFCASAGDNK